MKKAPSHEFLRDSAFLVHRPGLVEHLLHLCGQQSVRRAFQQRVGGKFVGAQVAQVLVDPVAGQPAEDPLGPVASAAEQVAGWWIPAPDGPVRLGTLAEVKVESVEATTIARSDGRPALSVNILKETDADAVEISLADSNSSLQLRVHLSLIRRS